jgi:choline monooxygenase
MKPLKSHAEVIEQIFDHIDHGTTDTGDETWFEPTINYTSPARLAAELALMRKLPVVFAPSAALATAGAYIARPVMGAPIIVVRDKDMSLRAFRNACRHRGATVAEGEGKARVFVCPYHGWTYGIDGALQHVPHKAGFPDLDESQNGLVPIHNVEEQGGLIFVSIDEPVDSGALAELPVLVDEDHRVFDRIEQDYAFNWKLNIEATLEGYHIKRTHEKTFYPYGYDNMNIVETFGSNGRIVFPFRRIEELREQAPEDWDISGKVTYVYNVFPNCTVAVLSNHISVSVSEPLAPDSTRFYSYRLGRLQGNETDEDLEKMQRDAKFVAENGLVEDIAVITRIQAGLSSGANTHFTYGLYEKAIVHLHKNIARLIGKV